MTKKRKRNPKPDDKEQSRRFVETAREYDIDESGKAFQSALDKIRSAKDGHKDKSDKPC